MRALLFHLSSLVGLLVLLNQLWNAEEIERTIFMAFAAGLVMYTVLMISYTVTQRFLVLVANTTADEPAKTGLNASEDEASSPA